MRRREFLTVPMAAFGERAESKPWHQRVRRVGQVNLNEYDPASIDVAAWAEYWASAKVNAVLVSVTGIVAFYPSKLAHFRRAASLGDRDTFGDCCAAAKQRGIRVIARFSPDLTWDEFLRVKPEWFERDRDGNPVPQNDAPGLYRTCMFTSYFEEHIPAIMREVNSRYDIDGIYTNGWPSLGRPPACFCLRCGDAVKGDVPEAYERYVSRVLELWKLYQGVAAEKREDNIFYANLGGGIHAVHNLKRLAGVCQWFNCDNQGRGAAGNAPAWGAAQQGRVAQSVMKGKTITNVTGAWSTTSPRYRNVAKAPAEAAAWLAQTVASGMVPWYHWLGAQTGLGEDRRWQEPGKRFLQWLARHEKHFCNKSAIANLGVVLGQRTNAFYKHPAPRSEATDSLQGLYCTLLEGRFLFDFVHEDDLGRETLSKYKVLLLPNVAFLSDEQCRQLRDYVKSGGSMLVTFETSLYDERGRPRGQFGLGDLFGIARAGERQGPFGNASFARIESQHEILRGFSDTNWIAGAEYWVPVKANGRPVLSVVPAYTAYPPERVVAQRPRSDYPAVVMSEAGTSRLAYFAGDIDRTAWQTGHTDLSQLLENTVRWLLGTPQDVTVEGEGVVELFAWETEAGYAVHVLNYNNPNLHRGWIRRHYPLGKQKVKMTLPESMKVGGVELLRAERSVPFRNLGGVVEFEIPRVDDYEVAVVV